jgi:membrane-associated PAP2 superfamily phosphatase
MGCYQIARGEHFLSHTLATAALAWLLCVGLAFLMRKPLEREVSSTS